MEGLDRIWGGLAGVAPRVDLWPVLRALGGPEAVASADVTAWRRAGLSLAQAEAVMRAEAWNIGGIRAGGEGWPAILDGVPTGPVALAAEGDVTLLRRTLVAVVGSRRCTSYGRVHARRIAEAVARAGGAVVSGLAWGIDCEAHEGAGGATVAVLGQGLLAPMPGWQARARQRLLERGGLVLSELPPHAPGASWTFPVRNRVISALSVATVVVEAAQRSGARITAGWARDHGREVLALPGPIDAPSSVGCLDLIEDGATMVRGPATVLDKAKLGRPRDTRGQQVLAAVGPGATVEEVAARTGLGCPEVRDVLQTLELTAGIIRLPGGRYRHP